MIDKQTLKKDYDVLDRHIKIMQTLATKLEKNELAEDDIKALHDLLEIKSEFEYVHSKVRCTDMNSADELVKNSNIAHEFTNKLKIVVDRHYDNVCNSKKSFIGS